MEASCHRFYPTYSPQPEVSSVALPPNLPFLCFHSNVDWKVTSTWKISLIPRLTLSLWFSSEVLCSEGLIDPCKQRNTFRVCMCVCVCVCELPTLRAARINISLCRCNPSKQTLGEALLWRLMESGLNFQAIWSQSFPFLNPLTSGFPSPVFTDDICNDVKLYE